MHDGWVYRHISAEERTLSGSWTATLAVGAAANGPSDASIRVAIVVGSLFAFESSTRKNPFGLMDLREMSVVGDYNLVQNLVTPKIFS